LKKNVGQIIVLSSLSGEVGLPYRTAYCSSKFAVTGFFEALRIEQEEPHVSITIVCPPSVFTKNFQRGLINSEGEFTYEK
jgi:short-subunit dehydrogenase